MSRCLFARGHVKAGSDPRDVEKTLESAGRLDILVNQCRISMSRALQDFPTKSGTHPGDQPVAAFHTTRSALPADAQEQWGRIINDCIRAMVSWPRRSSRPMFARQARHRRSHQSDRARNREQGITCNAICPGYVWTPLVEAQIDRRRNPRHRPRSRDPDVLLAQQPNSALPPVEELGALTVFLASEPPRRSPAWPAVTADGRLTSKKSKYRNQTNDNHSDIVIEARSLGSK